MKIKELVISLLSIFVLVSCGGVDEEHTQKSEVVRPIYTMQVGKQEDFAQRKFPGRAAAANAVTLAFEVSGKLNRVDVSVGERVKKGQLLASIDSRNFENRLAQAQAELKRTESQYERLKRALASNAVSGQDVANAEAAFKNAQATVKIRQKELEDTRLTAPYAAIVSAVFINNFGNVTAKQNAIRLVDPRRIEMQADVSENLISMARKGAQALVQFDAFPEILLDAVVDEVGTEASLNNGTFPVTLLMNQPKNVTILPGMSAKAWSNPKNGRSNIAESLRGFEVPVSAILSSQDGAKYVWVINTETNKVAKKPVQTGELTDKGVLVHGLEGGEIIAIVGVNSLQQDQQVKIVKP